MATVASLGFDADYYLQEKAAQMGTSTTEALAAITAAGLSLEEHYLRYGYLEGLSPNRYFNADQYATAKAAQMGGSATAATFVNAWYAASGSTNVYLHYLMYGDNESVNPSSGFDENAYYTAKAAQMGGGTTAAEAKTAIESAGLTALTHYLLYGINESLSYTPTPISVPGTTYNLTVNQDIINGGAFDNVINGVIGPTIATSTLQAQDVINGGSGHNTLNVVETDAATATAINAGTAPVLNGVTTLNVTDMNTTFGLNVNDLTGLTPDLTTIGIVGQAGAAGTSFIGISTDVTTLNFTNNINGGADNFTYAAGLTGSSDALTINASGNTQGGVGAVVIAGAAANAGFESVTINSTGTSNRFASLAVVDGAAASTMTDLTITGAAALTIAGPLDFKGTTGTVDASAATGAVSLTFGGIAGAENDTITGGSGNDRFAFAAAGDLTSDDTINGGAGTNTLAIADTIVNSTTAPLNAAIAAATNIQSLEFTGATATLDASLLDITDYKFTTTAGGAIGVTKAATNDTFTISGRTAGAVTIAPDAGTITGNLTLAGSSAAVAGAGGLTVTGFNTFDITSTGAVGVGPNVTGAYTTSAGATTNITGSHALTIANVATTGSIDASNFTGALTVTAAAAAVTLLGGSGNDVLNGSAATDTINGGAGDDIITGGVGKDVIVTGTGIDTVNIAATDSLGTGITAATAITKTALETNGTAYQSITAQAGDKIVFTTPGVGTANSVNDLGSTAAIEGSAITASGIEYWTSGGNTYVAVDINASGTLTAADTIVELVGVHTFTSSAVPATSLTLTLAS